ncbi:uncharacterized protein B0H18DRAFT_1165256 [Fomitopsis serialis]|uniref:uncharacterized protein n=1 Tax=Fomitopsis serialis TaxID=139415 RepID=UPI00200858E0|nr:uncharacterized protein B0H18DRAFT_1165256 [Neoantrodia serialis]KAH9936622.1 hypothetical protein B0H18DRAFT_1165256 [Neoantrodia serialis]
MQPTPTVGDTKSLLSRASKTSKGETKQLVGDLQTKLDETTAALDAKTRAVDSLEERVRTLSSSLEAAQAESSNADAALQAAEDAKAKLQTDLAEALRRSDDARHDHAEQSSQLEDARRQVAESMSTLETERAARLSTEQRLKSVEEDRDKLKTQHGQDEEVIAARDAAIQEVTRRLQTLASELTTTRDERDAQSDRAADLELDLSIVTKERAELDRRSEDYLCRVKALEAELDKAAAAMEEMANTVEAKEVDLQAAREDSRRLSDELDATRVESAGRSMQVEELAAELARSADALDQAKGRLVPMPMRTFANSRSLRNVTHRATLNSRDRLISWQPSSSICSRRKRAKSASSGMFTPHIRKRSTHSSTSAMNSNTGETTLQELQAELSEAEGALGSALRELDAAKVQLEEAGQRTAEIERAKAEVIEGLSADLSHARESQAALRETFLATDRHAKELESTARALQDEIRRAVRLLVDKADMQRKADAAYSRVSELDQMVEAGGVQITQLERDRGSVRRVQGSAIPLLAKGQGVANGVRRDPSKEPGLRREKEQTVARLSAELSRASQQAKTLQTELDTVRPRLSAADEKDQEIARLSKELADVREARNALTKKLNTSNEQARRHLLQAEDSNKKRADEAKQLRATHQAAVDELHGKHRSALQQQVKQSLQEIEKRDAELRAVRGDLAAANAALASAKQDVNTLKATLENYQHSTGSLDRTKDGIIAQLHNDYQGQIAALVAEKEEVMHRWNIQIRELREEHALLLHGVGRRERVARGVAAGLGVAGAMLTHFLF